MNKLKIVPRQEDNYKHLLVIGAGGLGREVAWLLKEINQNNPEWDFLGFIDDGVSGVTIEGYPILGTVAHLVNQAFRPWFVVAIADSRIRKDITEKLLRKGFPQATLIHPGVNRNFNHIEPGSIICSGTILTTNVSIGSNCIVNPGCFIGHDTILKDYVSLMPGTNVAGEVVIGEGCYLGLNVAVINQKSIGEWATVGAGTVVVENLPGGVVAVGVPARVVKRS